MKPYHRIVVKVGTNVITRDDGLLSEEVMASLAKQISELQKNGTEVILVSSGAMAAGRKEIDPSKELSDVAARQVLAAVGQPRLMSAYGKLFAAHGIICAQVLATKEDFRDRQHYLNMRSCFDSLLEEKVIPIVNENDVVAVSELMFTDNDELAGLIAAMMDSEALVLLTSVDGILDGDPKDPNTKVIPEIQHGEWRAVLRAERSSFGRGGMHTKCKNAEKLAALGITTVVASGKAKNVLQKINSGENIGTKFPGKKSLSSKKRWVAGSEGQEKGSVCVNTCAAEILSSGTKAISLLPVGVVKIDGEFQKGDVIRILEESGKSLGLGIAQYSATVAREAMGKHGQKPLVHYDYLSLF